MTPITAPTSPPRSNVSLSPIPSRPVKMKKPTSAPARPSSTVAKNPMGSRPGMSSRPRKPATMPRMIAPIMRGVLSAEDGFEVSASPNYPDPERRSHLDGAVGAPSGCPRVGKRDARVSTPLDGVRVLDLSRLLPGPFCSLLLADFGADVIKVEDTGDGDYIRWAPPGFEGAEETAKGSLFLSLNRGKRSVRVDLKTEAGRD